MLSKTPTRAHDVANADPDAPPLIDAPEYLVERYLELSAQRKQVDDQLAYVRAELEILAAPVLHGGAPRARFAAAAGAVQVRAMPTCVFDRADLARALQKEGRLADVATVTGPTLARFLASEPALAARLGTMVRFRSSVVLTTTAI